MLLLVLTVVRRLLFLLVAAIRIGGGTAGGVLLVVLSHCLSVSVFADIVVVGGLGVGHVFVLVFNVITSCHVDDVVAVIVG